MKKNLNKACVKLKEELTYETTLHGLFFIKGVNAKCIF
mgnify:CR=1 FL=1